MSINKNIPINYIVSTVSIPLVLWLGKLWLSRRVEQQQTQLIPKAATDSISFKNGVVNTVALSKITKGASEISTAKSKKVDADFQMVDRNSVETTILTMEMHSKIYDLLDQESQLQYKRVCKCFYTTFQELDPFLSKIEKFIQENYEVIGGYPSKMDIKRFFLSPSFIIGFGEHHERPHQLLNATLVNYIWRFYPHYRFFIEGGETSLKTWKKERSGMLKYLRPEIADAAKTWDLDILKNEEGSGILNKAFDYAYTLMENTQRLFQLYADKHKWTFDAFCQFLDDTFEKEEIKGFWDIAASGMPKESLAKYGCMQKYFQVMASDSKMGREWAMEYLKLKSLLHIQTRADKPAFQAACDEIDQRRDQRLKTLALHTLNERGVGLFFAGAEHINNLRDFFNKRCAGYVRYLCLQPRNSVTRESTLSSDRRIFWQQTRQGPKIEAHSIQREETIVDEAPKPMTFKEKMHCFLAFDLGDLDYGINHYDIWAFRTRELIDIEIQSTRAHLAVLEEEV